MTNCANPSNEKGDAHNLANPRQGSKAEHNCNTPRVFIPISDQATQELQQLYSVIGVIIPGHGSPTKEEIVNGLRELSSSLRHHGWKLYMEGSNYLTRFPSPAGLEIALCQTSVSCKGYQARFRVVRWGDEEGIQHHKFAVKAWIAINDVLFNH